MESVMVFGVRALIKNGCQVKISRRAESFWVEVLQISKSGKKIRGRIDNELITSKYKYGDVITFRTSEIIEVWTE